jgi:hypothetical protein
MSLSHNNDTSDPIAYVDALDEFDGRPQFPVGARHFELEGLSQAIEKDILANRNQCDGEIPANLSNGASAPHRTNLCSQRPGKGWIPAKET